MYENIDQIRARERRATRLVCELLRREPGDDIQLHRVIAVEDRERQALRQHRSPPPNTKRRTDGLVRYRRQRRAAFRRAWKTNREAGLGCAS